MQIASCLWRRRRRQTTETERAHDGTGIGLLAARISAGVHGCTVTGYLPVPMDVELVALRRLYREPRAEQLEALRTLRFPGHVGFVQPFGRIARVLVGKDARNRPVLSFIARRTVV